MHEEYDFTGFDKTAEVTVKGDMVKFHKQMHPGEVRGVRTMTKFPNQTYNQGMQQAVWHHFFMVVILVLIVTFLFSGTMFFVKQLRENKK